MIMRALSGAFLAVMVAMAPTGSALSQSSSMAFGHPDSATGHYLAGLAALDELKGERAARHFARALEVEPDNVEFVQRAFVAQLMAGNVPDAAALAQRLLDLGPDDELARLTLGTVALKQRRYASADQTLGRVRPISLVGVTAGIMRAWSQLGGGDYSLAAATLQEVAQGGFEEFLVFHRAILADLGGAREQALALSREAHEMDPFVTRIAEARIRILANAGQFDEAQAVIQAFDEQGIVHPLIDALRGPVFQERRPGLFTANVQSAAAEMYHGLGAALARDGSSELGVVFMRLALYLDPDMHVVALNLGEILSAQERHDDANAIYRSIPGDSPLQAMATIRLAENLDNQGQREEALAELREIVEEEPDNLEAYGILGDILRYDEQWEESAAAYSAIIERIDGDRPSDWRFFYVRGIAYERSGQWELAEADFLKALDLNPDHPHVLNYLGYSWVDMGINLEEGLELIERAVELRPRDGYIIDSLGWAFYRLGRIDEAVAQLERALQFLPNDPEINDHLGDAYWRAGREREAMFQWRIAIHVDDRGDVTERATPKLQGGLEPLDEAGD